MQTAPEAQSAIHNTKRGDVLVTGATGNVGAALIATFPERERLVIATRSPDKARQQLGEDLRYIAFDFEDPTTQLDAFNNIHQVFLVRPPAISDVKTYIAPVIGAAKRADVKHVVFLSLQGVENNTVVPHYKIERLLESSSMSWTFLRAGFFMQNLSTTHSADIREGNQIFIPAGNAEVSFIDARDIGEVAAITLVQSGHENRAYTLTGGEAINYHKVAEIFTEVLGRSIRYISPSLPRFVWRMCTRHNHRLMHAVIMALLYTNTRRGMAATVSPDTQELLGRPPRSMHQFVEDHADVWR